MAEELLTTVIQCNPTLKIEVRGDDIRITGQNQYYLAVIYYIYVALGFKINPAKFALCKGRGEFLRVDITVEGAVALAAQTAPAVV